MSQFEASLSVAPGPACPRKDALHGEHPASEYAGDVTFNARLHPTPSPRPPLAPTRHVLGASPRRSSRELLRRNCAKLPVAILQSGLRPF